MKRAASFERDGLKARGVNADAVGVEVGEDVERRIEAVYLMEMRFGEGAN